MCPSSSRLDVLPGVETKRSATSGLELDPRNPYGSVVLFGPDAEPSWSWLHAGRGAGALTTRGPQTIEIVYSDNVQFTHRFATMQVRRPFAPHRHPVLSIHAGIVQTKTAPDEITRTVSKYTATVYKNDGARAT